MSLFEDILQEIKMLNIFLPITDKIVDTAASVARRASSRIAGEQDSIEVMENPVGLYWGLMDCSASFKLTILAKILPLLTNGLPKGPLLEVTVE